MQDAFDIIPALDFIEQSKGRSEISIDKSTTFCSECNTVTSYFPTQSPIYNRGDVRGTLDEMVAPLFIIASILLILAILYSLIFVCLLRVGSLQFDEVDYPNGRLYLCGGRCYVPMCWIVNMYVTNLEDAGAGAILRRRALLSTEDRREALEVLIAEMLFEVDEENTGEHSREATGYKPSKNIGPSFEDNGHNRIQQEKSMEKNHVDLKPQSFGNSERDNDGAKSESVAKLIHDVKNDSIVSNFPQDRLICKSIHSEASKDLKATNLGNMMINRHNKQEKINGDHQSHEDKSRSDGLRNADMNAKPPQDYANTEFIIGCKLKETRLVASPKVFESTELNEFDADIESSIHNILKEKEIATHADCHENNMSFAGPANISLPPNDSSVSDDLTGNDEDAKGHDQQYNNDGECSILPQGNSSNNGKYQHDDDNSHSSEVKRLAASGSELQHERLKDDGDCLENVMSAAASAVGATESSMDSMAAGDSICNNGNDKNYSPHNSASVKSHLMIQGPSGSLEKSNTSEENNECSVGLINLDQSSSTCAICLDELYVQGQQYAANPQVCMHAFHKECLLDWLMVRNNTACPYCRADWVSNSQILEVSKRIRLSKREIARKKRRDELQRRFGCKTCARVFNSLGERFTNGSSR